MTTASRQHRKNIRRILKDKPWADQVTRVEVQEFATVEEAIAATFAIRPTRVSVQIATHS